MLVRCRNMNRRPIEVSIDFSYVVVHVYIEPCIGTSIVEIPVSFIELSCSIEKKRLPTCISYFVNRNTCRSVVVFPVAKPYHRHRHATPVIHQPPLPLGHSQQQVISLLMLQQLVVVVVISATLVNYRTLGGSYKNPVCTTHHPTYKPLYMTRYTIICSPNWCANQSVPRSTGRYKVRHIDDRLIVRAVGTIFWFHGRPVGWSVGRYW